MHVYRHSIAHTIFPGFHLRAFTHISLERERGEKRRRKKKRFSHKEMHVYRRSFTHTIFSGFIWGLLHTYHWGEKERKNTPPKKKKKKEKKKKKKNPKKSSFSHKEMHVYRRSFTQLFQIFTGGLLHTHFIQETLFTQGNACIQSFFHTILPDFHGRAFTHTLHSRNSFYTRKCMYTLFSHNPSTFSCEGFYTHITQETLFTQENECIKAFFSTVFHFYSMAFTHICSLRSFLLVWQKERSYYPHWMNPHKPV